MMTPLEREDLDRERNHYREKEDWIESWFEFWLYLGIGAATMGSFYILFLGIREILRWIAHLI